MPFNPIDTRARVTRETTRDPDGVVIAIYNNSGRTNKTNDKAMTVFVGENVLRSMGLKVGSRVTLSEGTGADHGLFQITPAPPGTQGFTLSSKKDGSHAKMASFTVRLARLSTLCNVDRAYIAEPTTFQRFGSALIFAVPWCHAPVAVEESEA
jgi:hypothetical protein